MSRIRRFFSVGNIRTLLLLCLALSMLSDALCNPLRLSVEWLQDEKLISGSIANILWRVPPWLYVLIAVAFYINISRMSARLLQKLFPRVPVFGLWLWGALSFFSKGMLPLLTASVYLAQRRQWVMAMMAAALSVFVLLPEWKSVIWVLTCSLLIYVGNAVLFWQLPLSGRRPRRAILITTVIAGMVGLAALALNSAIASGGVAAFREMHEHFDKATRTEVEAREKDGVSADLPLWRKLAAAESDPYFKSFRTSEFRLPDRQACVAPEAANRELLKQLEPILKHRPAVVQYHYDREMDPEPSSDALPGIKLAANALARRAALATQRGDWLAAADDMAAIESLSELAGNSFGGTAYLSRLYCLWARQRMINGLLADPKVPDKVLADIQRQLQVELEKEPEHFRKMLRDWYIKSYEAITSDIVAEPSSYNLSVTRLELYLIFRSLRKAVYFDTLAEPEILKRLPAYQEKRAKIPGLLNRAKRLTFKWDYFQTALIRRSDLRSALAGIAIEQYRRKYGKRPDSLEVLSPEFLNPDFFSPKYCPLKLEPTSFEQEIDDHNYHLTGIRIVNSALKHNFFIVDHVEKLK